MNELIKELALQAGMGETELGVGKIHQFYGDGLERFAQLIVREMLKTCEEHPAWYGRNIGEQIKKDFEVEL